MTEKDAYLAMFYFLDGYYDRTKSDEIGSLLGDMTLLKDNKPADQAILKDWHEAVMKAMKHNMTK